MPAEEPKGQHFVHRAYLEGFQDPELEKEGKPALWVYMPGKSPFPQRPERVAKRNYYYCYEREEQRQFEAEHSLQELEDAAMPTLHQLRSRRFDLSSDDRLTFAGYIALSHVRVPTFQRSVDRVANLAQAWQLEMVVRDDRALQWVAQKFSEETGEQVDPEELKRRLTGGSVFLEQTNRGWSLQQMFKAMLTLQLVIFRMTWTFVLAPDNDPGFLTSDNPVSLFDPLMGPARGIGFASSRAAHFSFPISRDMCLVATHGKAPYTSHVKPSTVRAMNKANITRADTQIYAPFNSAKIQKIVDDVVLPRKRRVLIQKGRVVEE